MKLKTFLRKLFFGPERIRKELRFVKYSEADDLIKAGWTLAKEEDTNRAIGMVYLELLVDMEKK